MGNREKSINIFWISLIGILILYFFYHIIIGKYGVISYIESSDGLNKKKILSEEIVKDMKQRKNKIKRMKGENIDIDILDEEVRKKFGYAKKNEIVIYTKDLEEL